MEAESQVMYAYIADYSQQHEEQKCLRFRPRKLFSMEQGVDGESDFPRLTTPESYTVPIVGYEIVEQRQRFTVYKIHVQKQARSWFIFRRYSDFERLNEKLVSAFPRIKLKLPPKRRFGDNFNPDFIAKRAQGLQTFIKMILQHRNLRICHQTQEFFCLDDPPGPFDSLEESRAYVQYLEEQMENTKTIVKELSSQLEATKSQLSQARVQIKSLECTLQSERLQRKSPNVPSHSTPATGRGDSLSCEAMDVQLSDISDGCSVAVPKTKSRKSVSFARTKAASEGNLLLLKNNPAFPTLKEQTNFRHSITFGEDSFDYSGFLDVEFHSNVTNKIKDRKRKVRKDKEKKTKCVEKREKDNSVENASLRNKQKEQKVSQTRQGKDRKQEKRDSGIIRDSFTDSDF